MKVLLINPALELQSGEVINIIAPLGLAYIAAVLEKDKHQVKILDLPALSWKNPLKIKKGKKIISRYSPGENFIVEFLLQFSPDIVGISNLVSPTEEETIKLAGKIKKFLPQTKVVVGGSNASVRSEQFIKDPNIDFVVVGEGELTMKELLRKLSKKEFSHILGLVYKTQKGTIKINSPRPFIKDLSLLPFPAWHLLPMEEYFHYHSSGVFIKKERVATMIASRGCPNACSFCTNRKIWGSQWRSRSVSNVISEIRALKKLYRVQEIQFLDNNISVNRDLFTKLCLALKKEKIVWNPSGGMAVLTINSELIKLMAESGCYVVQFGIEHGDPQMQKRIGKIVPLEATKKLVEACHQNGIWTHGNFVVGLPGETMKTAYKSLEYAIAADLDSLSFFTALPLPGSKVFEEVIGNKKVDPDDLRFYVSKARCSQLSNSQINKIITTSFRKFLLFRIKRELNPGRFFRRIKLIRSRDDLRFYWITLGRFIQISTKME